jgi:hypothetical protein
LVGRWSFGGMCGLSFAVGRCWVGVGDSLLLLVVVVCCWMFLLSVEFGQFGEVGFIRSNQI